MGYSPSIALIPGAGVAGLPLLAMRTDLATLGSVGLPKEDGRCFLGYAGK